MLKFYNVVMKTVNRLFLIVLGIFLILSLIVKAVYVGTNDSPAFEPVAFLDILFIFCWIFLFWAFYHFRNKLEKILKIKWIYLIYFILGILFILFVPLKTFSDMDAVYQAALEVLNGNIKFLTDSAYFNLYPNNVIIVFLEALLLFIFPNTVVTLKIANLLMIMGIGWMTVKIVVQIWPKFCYPKLLLLYTMSQISIFLYINHIYTDIPFVFLSLFSIWLYLKDQKYYWITCLIAAFNYFIRPLSVIYMIAITMDYFSRFFEGKVLKKQFIKIIFGGICGFLGLFIAINSFIIPQIIPENSKSVPVWSYIYMAFNQEEFGFQDGSHSVDRSFGDVKERLENYSPEEIIEIVAKKTYWTWTEGTYQASRYAFGQGETEEAFSHSTWITEHFHVCQQKGRILLDCLMRAQYIVILMGTYIALWKCKKKEIDLFKLLFYGFFIFYISWEIKSRYLISLYPFMAILSFIGFMKIFDKINRKIYKEKAV